MRASEQLTKLSIKVAFVEEMFLYLSNNAGVER